MEIKLASVLVSALLVFLAPEAKTQENILSMEETCCLFMGGLDGVDCSEVAPLCVLPPSSGDEGDNRKKRSYHYGPPHGRFHLDCPSATDQSAIYELNENPFDVPIAQAIFEIITNIPLIKCLLRELVLPRPPEPYDDAFLQESQATCSSTVQELRFYKSADYPGNCLRLNVGALVFYEECSGNPYCQGCKQPSKRWCRQKKCITLYRSVNFWAYCPDQPATERIVRDKIIIPVACKCLEFPCKCSYKAHY